MGLFDMEEGAFYRCQRCTNCCRWPGEVPVTGEEIDTIADFLGVTADAFIARFTTLRRSRRGLTLIEEQDGKCVFLDGIDCRIQEVKPNHCAGFPNRWNFPGWRSECEARPEWASDDDTRVKG